MGRVFSSAIKSCANFTDTSLLTLAAHSAFQHSPGTLAACQKPSTLSAGAALMLEKLEEKKKIMLSHPFHTVC